MRHYLFQKREIRDPQHERSWPTLGLWLIFINLLPDYLHQILNVRSLYGSVWFALIRVLLIAWGRGSATPLTAPVQAVSVTHGREG